MIGDNVRRIRNNRGFSMDKIRELTGLSKSTISELETNKSNPTSDTLQKIADALDVDITDFYADLDDNSNKNSTPKEIPDEFSTPEDAIKFILEQNVIMGFGGFDVNKMSDDDVLEFANELLNQLRLLSYKYKK